METIKAGCYLINKKTKKVALIYREKQKDFSFPKGHKENGELIKECAIREVAEETKRVATIVDNIEPIVESYITPSGENCKCFMFVALDEGPSDNKSEDSHEVVWTDVDDVENVLSYKSLKSAWIKIKRQIKILIEN